MHTKRWIVTYTKHMKQKRKVYHDGFVELCGSTGKVMLYDDCEKLVDSRFLKKDEIIESGATLSFETHLVDIGNCYENPKPSSEENRKSSEPVSQIKKRNTIHTNTSKNHSNALQEGIEVKRKFVHADTSTSVGRLTTNETSIREWHVLYTNQLTQKAKRYHDGIMKVLVCSSHMNQIILLNEDRDVLSSKYMKSVEHVGTGNKCEFPNYLVEICEPRHSGVVHEGNSSNICFSSSRKDKDMKDSMKQVQLSKFGKKEIPATTTKEGGSSNVCSSNKDKGMKDSMKQVQLSKIEKDGKFASITKDLQKDHSENARNFCSPNVDSLINSSTVPLRDVVQILSILKKPTSEGSFDPLEHGLMSQSSHNGQHDVHESSSNSGNSAWCDLKCEFEKTGTSVELTSEASQVASISTPAVVIDDDCEGCASSSDHLPSLSSGIVALTASATESSSEKVGIRQTCSTSNNSVVLGNLMLPGS